jgi:hypothetical protein
MWRHISLQRAAISTPQHSCGLGPETHSTAFDLSTYTKENGKVVITTNQQETRNPFNLEYQETISKGCLVGAVAQLD